MELWHYTKFGGLAAADEKGNQSCGVEAVTTINDSNDPQLRSHDTWVVLK